jgi:hypothetical protein
MVFIMTEELKEKKRRMYELRDEKGRVRMEFAQSNSLKFGSYYCIHGVPCIELIVPDNDEESIKEFGEHKVYLSAFRRYAFQISGTRDGEWCLGETPVFGLETFSTIRQVGPSNLSQDSTEKFIIVSCAMMAIQDYCSRYSLCPPNDALYFGGSNWRNTEWQKFIENTQKFCKRIDIPNTEEEAAV